MWHDYHRIADSQRAARRVKRRRSETWVGAPLIVPSPQAASVARIDPPMPVSLLKKELRANLVRLIEDQLKTEARATREAVENEWHADGDEPVVHPLALAIRRSLPEWTNTAQYAEQEATVAGVGGGGPGDVLRAFRLQERARVEVCLQTGAFRTNSKS